MKSKLLFGLCVNLCFFTGIPARGFNIYADFPSGNIVIDKIKNDTIWMRPDLRDTEGNWFYWCFAVNQAKDKRLTFIFTRPDVITTGGPAVSYDSGLNWSWLKDRAVTSGSFSFTFETDREVRFSMGMPYTQENFDLFIQLWLKADSLSLETLTKTKSGRDVERLIIKPVASKEKYKVLVTARHHACEMMANYVMEGMIRKVMKDQWLRDHVQFCFIPFVDKDGVENGDQGKNRYPRDHNRDYSGQSIYKSTSAIRKWVPEWAENKLAVCLDLHCPWIKGEDHEHIYMPGSGNERIAEQQKLFCELLKETNNGELKISGKIYYPFGTGWNTEQNTVKGFSFTKWAAGLKGVYLGTAIEIPYRNNEAQTVEQENSRVFGEDLANAVKMYLKQL